MLTSIAPREVHSSGSLDSRDFTIAATGKAFKALINSQYSDKIKAPVRELWSNAYDSHVAAGIGDEPFECQLPTVFEPVFRVRDYGVSMSHEDIMGLYSVLFESSKEGTDKQVGKWGLGSKSPFAYVDTFTVTAWLAGEKRMYSAYIGTVGVPRIDLMLREPSDEPTGFEVQFPVKADDVDAFASVANKVALGFHVLPTIIGRTVKFTKLATIIEDPGLWALCRADEGYFNTGTAYARLGCVVYPIDANAIPNVTDEQASVLRSPFFIEFALSDCEITVNREALDYTDKTCRNVLAAADIIIEEVRRRYSKEMLDCTTYWEACNAFIALQQGGLHSALRDMLVSGLTWRGRKLTATISLQYVLRRSSPLHPQAHATFWSYSGMSRKSALKWDPSHYINYYKPSETAVYFEDTRGDKPVHHAHLRVRYHYDQQNNYKSLIWIKGDPTSMSVKRLFVAMGRPPMVFDVNTLPKAPIDKNYAARRITKLKLVDGYRFRETTVDESDPIIYVELDRRDINSPFGGTHTVSTNVVQTVRQHMISLGGYELFQVIGVPRSCKKVLKRNPHWRLLWDVARDLAVMGFDPVRAARAEKCAEIKGEDDFEFAKRILENGLRPAATMSPMGKLVRLYERIVKRADSLAEQRKWYDLAKHVIPDIVLPAYKVHWEPLSKKVKETYPMLLAQSSYINSKDLPVAVDYVNLVDKYADLVDNV